VSPHDSPAHVRPLPKRRLPGSYWSPGSPGSYRWSVRWWLWEWPGSAGRADAAIDSPGGSSGSNDGSPASVSVLISGTRIDGTILHNEFTITSFPTVFVSTLSVVAVARARNSSPPQARSRRP